MTRKLPTEVELAIRLQPCLAERRTYERADEEHPCAFFADQGAFHSFDLRDGGPPPKIGIMQPAHYAGMRRVTPEMLSGCRKAPIMSVGINPNLPGFWQNRRHSLLPVFDDVLQYAHHYRYRAIGKLQIPRDDFDDLRADKPDGAPLADEGAEIPTELSDQTMYQAYQSLLDGLAEGMQWANAKLTVGEDLSYGNMVACGSPRWITKPDPKTPSLPVMTPSQQRGVVQECFVERRHFLRQLFQSLPRVLLVFSTATRDAFIRAMQGHFVEGNPQVGENLQSLLGRNIVLRYGTMPDGRELRARVLFVPHASGNPAGFKEVQRKVIDALVAEANAGRLELAPDGHLLRSQGGCTFCDNALYKIGDCDYVAQLVPLAAPLEESGGDEAMSKPELRERAVQEKLLDSFLSPLVAVEESSIGTEEADSGGAPVRHVLIGRVVTMNAAFDVLDNHAVYVNDGAIEAIRPENAAAPPGYDDVPRVQTNGTMYPGLIDLHNHVAYNALPPWQVPRRFEDRGQWRRRSDYRNRMAIMGRLEAGNPARAVARYVEVKSMLGGVTTLQGMRSSFKPVTGAMRGLVRNVENSDEGMPGAGSGVLDLNLNRPDDVERFRTNATRTTAAYFYHLSEGINSTALRFWNDLVENSLIGPGLAGIHCLAVPEDGFVKLREAGASLIWSPTSNLMLYGQTLPLKAVFASGVQWALGCDWSVSGGKNPLFELKMARAEATRQGVDLPARDLVAAVTLTAARALRWHGAVGSLAEGMRADLIVLAGTNGNSYDNLVDATEADLVLSMIDGVARVGTKPMFDELGMPVARRETVRVKNRDQQLWLREEGTVLHGFTLERATKLLHERMLTEVVEEEESAAFDSFQLVLDDEMAPIIETGTEEAGEVVLQTPDTLTVLEDEALWAALRGIPHFVDKHDVDTLRAKYQ